MRTRPAGASSGIRAISAEAPGAASTPAPSGTRQNPRAAASSRACARASGSAVQSDGAKPVTG